MIFWASRTGVALGAVCLPLFLAAQSLRLSNGLTIRQSATVDNQRYVLPAAAGDGRDAVITIEGEHIEVDFQRAQLIGATTLTHPDSFEGVGVKVRGKDITLRNLRISGYKVALIADQVEHLRLTDCDFSYNYRPGHPAPVIAFSTETALAGGAAVVLEGCHAPEIKGCKMKANQNALCLSQCQEAIIWNNTIQFNAGAGIGIQGGKGHKIMHNRTDWNVGQASGWQSPAGAPGAGIVLLEVNQSTVAYNSATHCGTGLQMSGSDNIIFGNEFSFAANTGISAASGSNEVRGNLFRECPTGIAACGPDNMIIAANYLASCPKGIVAHDDGTHQLVQNLFQNDSLGIYIGAGAAGNQRSSGSSIDRNVFLQVRRPLHLDRTTGKTQINGENLFADFEDLLTVTPPEQSFQLLRNDIYTNAYKAAQLWKQPGLADFKSLNFIHDGAPEDPYKPLEIPVNELHEPDSLKGGMSTALPADFPQGRQFILTDQWGPYDFRRPIAAIDTIVGNLIAITLLGPAGDWKVTGMNGLESINAKSGTLPAALILEKSPKAGNVVVEFEYAGPEVIYTVFGARIPPGERYRFVFRM